MNLKRRKEKMLKRREKRLALGQAMAEVIKTHKLFDYKDGVKL